MSQTAQNCFKRCKHKVTMMVLKLKTQLEVTHMSTEDLLAAAQEKFISSFEYYETDKQYLGFIFIVIKNKIRDIKTQEIKWARKHVSDETRLPKNGLSGKGDENVSYLELLNNLAEDCKYGDPLDNLVIKDLIETIQEKLKKDLHKEIFRCIVDGKIDREIGEECLRSTSNISQLRRTVIWPLVKDVLKISEDKYEKLIDSGRVNYKLMSEYQASQQLQEEVKVESEGQDATGL